MNRLHSAGTYSSIIPTDVDKTFLHQFLLDLGIPSLIDKDEYHCTIVYSNHPCPKIETENFELPCKAIPTGYAVFGQDSQVLVMTLYCPHARSLHKRFKEKYNAVFDYPQYTPHITIADNFLGSTPTELPDIILTFDSYVVEPLDADK